MNIVPPSIYKASRILAALNSGHKHIVDPASCPKAIAAKRARNANSECTILGCIMAAQHCEQQKQVRLRNPQILRTA